MTGQEAAVRAWRVPDEAEPHAGTLMAWPPTWSWGRHTAAVRSEVAAIARAVAEFEPVTVLAGPRETRSAQRACGGAVEVWPVPVDDLWVRDTGPVHVLGPDGELAGVDLNFNGWGRRQRHRRDALVARRVLEEQGTPRVTSRIVAEGGALEVDGSGTLLATESSLLHRRRNPGWSRDELERELRGLLGVSRVVWLAGVRDEDVTDCHVDGLARFACPGVVLLTAPPDGAPRDLWTAVHDQAWTALHAATGAGGERIFVVEVPEPEDNGARGRGFAGTYVNYYVVNGAVVVPAFGDRRADKRAASTIGELYPGRTVVPVPISAIAEGGGGIHCATRHLPAPERCVP